MKTRGQAVAVAQCDPAADARDLGRVPARPQSAPAISDDPYGLSLRAQGAYESW